MKCSPKEGFLCPVCQKVISEKHLPSIESVIDDELCYLVNFKIVNSTVTFICNFDHFYDEEKDMILEDMHPLTAVIRAEFDSSCECISFTILEISSREAGRYENGKRERRGSSQSFRIGRNK